MARENRSSRGKQPQRHAGRQRQEQRSRSDLRRRQEQQRKQEERRRRESRRRQKRKRRRIRSLIRLVLWLFVLAGIVGAGSILLPVLCVEKDITVEAGGSRPEAADFLRWESRTARILSGLDEDTDLNRVTDYKVVLEVYGKEVASTLHVEDTVAPVVTAKDKTIYAGEEIAAEDFIEEVTDETETTARFEEYPDCETSGSREVTLIVSDEGGNVTKATARLEVAVDTEPPVISGVKDLTVPAGGNISYKKGITVTDNIDEEVELTVDASGVDLAREGEYEVLYKAVDAAGNEASASAVVHVQPVSVDNITEELVNAEADKILASLFGEGAAAESLSEYDKAKKIYNWCHDRIAYFDGTPKTNWIQGAYRGLVERKGDCYVYAMTAKCLLTRAGIKNMDIEKIPTPTTMHYWNLVDLGEGWYHFDTCRRVDGATFFYKTDEELMAYSNTHDGTHNYDRSKYPEIQ